MRKSFSVALEYVAITVFSTYWFMQLQQIQMDVAAMKADIVGIRAYTDRVVVCKPHEPGNVEVWEDDDSFAVKTSKAVPLDKSGATKLHVTIDDTLAAEWDIDNITTGESSDDPDRGFVITTKHCQKNPNLWTVWLEDKRKQKTNAIPLRIYFARKEGHRPKAYDGTSHVWDDPNCVKVDVVPKEEATKVVPVLPRVTGTASK